MMDGLQSNIGQFKKIKRHKTHPLKTVFSSEFTSDIQVTPIDTSAARCEPVLVAQIQLGSGRQTVISAKRQRQVTPLCDGLLAFLLLPYKKLCGFLLRVSGAGLSSDK